MRHWAFAAAVTAAMIGGDALAQNAKPVPYWVSLSASRARIRTGPSLDYPATWEFRRRGLPLKVVQVRDDWRKVEDPEGEQGWMKFTLLSEQRTGIVTGGVHALHAAPDTGSRIVWRVAPGVVGALAKCSDGWCLFDVGGRTGYIRSDALWGLSAGETIR